MRLEFAYLIIALLLAGFIVLVWQTRRYRRYEARRIRGQYDKPVRRPFWLP